MARDSNASSAGTSARSRDLAKAKSSVSDRGFVFREGAHHCQEPHFSFSRTTGILIGRWASDSDFSSGIYEGKSRSVGDLAPRARGCRSIREEGESARG